MAKKTNKTKNIALLDPGDSCLLFIDFDEKLPSIRPEAPAPIVGPDHHEILHKAADLSVPSFLSSMARNDREASSSPLHSLVPKGALLWRSMINPWKDDHLRQTISDQRRQCLILAGGWPEGSLTQAALGALGEAYDIHVLFDLCNGLLDLQNSPVAARLIQAGIVPLTARQLILEWTDAAGAAQES